MLSKRPDRIDEGFAETLIHACTVPDDPLIGKQPGVADVMLTDGEADQPRSTEMSSTRRYLVSLYADHVGTAIVGLGMAPYLTNSGRYRHTLWREVPFRWPAQAEELECAIVEAAQDCDVYICTVLMAGDERTPAAAVHRDVLHSDCDTHVDLSKVTAVGGFVVESGSDGHGHVYVPLAESVTSEEYDLLERGLADYLHADSKIAANDVLRPPGTLNHKPTAYHQSSDPSPVKFLIEPDGTRNDVYALALLLDVQLPSVSPPRNTGNCAAAVAADTAGSVFSLEDPRYVAVVRALEQISSPPDRSADTARVVGACYDLGLTLSQSRFAVGTRADLVERLEERDDDDVLTLWLKIDEDRRRSREGSSPNAIARGATEGGAAAIVADFEKGVQAQLSQLRTRDEARRRYAQETQGRAASFDAGLLSDYLRRPEQARYRIDGLLPAEGGMLVVAQRKTGKTTLMLNLARSLVTGEPFLGSFVTRPIAGRVAILNYEVSGSQLARWATEVHVPPDRLVQVNLRGRRDPLSHIGDRAELASLLRSHQVESLIVDPFGRAYRGTSQNDSGEVGTWLVNLDQFARDEAGAQDLVLTAHAGWNGERTRGSSALEDWSCVQGRGVRALGLVGVS